MRIGKGRVVAISDTTFLSSFCLYYPGIPGWIMQVIGWAVGEPARPGWTFLASILGCLLGAFLLGFDGRIIGYCGLGVSLVSVGTWGYLQGMQAKQADTIPRDVCFLHAWSRMSVKSILLIEGGAHDPSDYGTLYAVSVQLSLKPGLHGPLPDPQARRAVVVNPQQIPPQRILQTLQAWVRQGGWLYLCTGHEEKSRRVVERWSECLGEGNPPGNHPPPFLDKKALSSLGEIRWIRQGEGMIVCIMEGSRVTTESLESIGTEEISDEAFRRRQGWFELLKGPDEQEKS